MATVYSPDSFALLLKKLVLTPTTFTTDDVRSAFHHLATVDGALPGQIGAFVTALKLTGKDALPEVVAACAEVMREYAVSIEVRATVEGEGPICDIVGTGGDGQNTFNVSTTAGIVAAGAGCRVYKHGNKAATSSSGSADILLSLSCPIMTLPPSSIASISAVSPFLFLYAPSYHPTMARIGPVRKTLGFPTVFNVLGPLINPARPEAMVVGVHSDALGPIFIEALRLLNVKSAWVVCGREGLDEISPAGETTVWELKDDQVTIKTISPATFGLASHPLSSVVGGTPLENASTLLALLRGDISLDDPIENFVVLNAAALLVVAGIAKDEVEGVRLARESISSGKAGEALDRFREASQKYSTAAI